MPRPRRGETGFVKVEGAGAVADEVLSALDEAPVTPEVTEPAPVVVEIVEQAPDPEPPLSAQTLAEMEAGRQAIERYQ